MTRRYWSAPVLSDAEFRRRLAAVMARHETERATGTRRLRACAAPTMAGWRADTSEPDGAA